MKEYLKSNIFSLIFTIGLISIISVFAGNVFVDQGSLEIEELNASGDLEGNNFYTSTSEVYIGEMPAVFTGQNVHNLGAGLLCLLLWLGKAKHCPDRIVVPRGFPDDPSFQTLNIFRMKDKIDSGFHREIKLGIRPAKIV